LPKISDVPYCIKGCTHKSKIPCPLLRQDSTTGWLIWKFLKTPASSLVYFLDLFGFLNCQSKPIIFFMSDWSKPEIYAFSFQCGFEIKKKTNFCSRKVYFLGKVGIWKQFPDEPTYETRKVNW